MQIVSEDVDAIIFKKMVATLSDSTLLGLSSNFVIVFC